MWDTVERTQQTRVEDFDGDRALNVEGRLQILKVMFLNNFSLMPVLRTDGVL